MFETKNDMIKKLILFVSVAMSLFHLYTSATVPLSPMSQRSLHLGFALALIFLYAAQGQKSVALCVLFILLSACSFAVNLSVFLFSDEMSLRTPHLITSDYLTGIILVVLILYGAYLAAGLWLPVIALLIIGYAYIGRYITGPLHIRAISPARFFSSLYFATDGIFGNYTGVSSTYIFIFILYSQMLLQYGLGDYLVDVSRRLFGTGKGSAVKCAIFSSSVFGMLNVRSVLNLTGTASRTIPMMKKEGYDAAYAGGVCAAAAAGGKLIPPLLGLSSFYMVSQLNLSYAPLCLILLPPAVLYFTGMLTRVLRKPESSPTDVSSDDDHVKSAKELLLHFWRYAPSVFVLLYRLIHVQEPLARSVFYAILVLMISHFLYLLLSKNKICSGALLSQLTGIMEDACEIAVETAVSTACAGIIFGVFYAVSLNIRFTSLMMEITGGMILPLILIAILFSLILGMHAPAITVYILISSLFVAPLRATGMNDIIAHVLIFYYVNLATVSPFGGTASRCAALLAHAPKRNTYHQAFLIALPGFVIPVLFVLHPSLILGDTALDWIGTFFSCALGTAALACGVSGFLRIRATVTERLLLVAGACCMFVCQSIWAVTGLCVILLALVLNLRRNAVGFVDPTAR